MIIYFIDGFDRETCRYPMNMLDSNIASNYGKIMQLFAMYPALTGKRLLFSIRS